MNITTITRAIALFSAFVIPLSTSLTTVTSILLVIMCLLAFDYRNFKNPAAISLLVLLGCYLLAASFSLGTGKEITQSIHKMSRLLYFPLLLPFFSDERWRKYVISAFVAAVSISVACTMYSSGIIVFKDSIITSLLVSFSIFILAHFAMESKRWRWLCIALAIFLTYYLLFVSIGRSGQIIFFILAAMFSMQRFGSNLRFQLLAGVTLLAVFLAIIFVPSSFMQRQKIAWQEMQEYSSVAERDIPNSSSIGTRLIYAHNAWLLIQQKPLLGWGTGSYAKAYAEYAPEAQYAKDKRNNPHNQYLFTWVETGIPGLLALLAIFGSFAFMFARQKNIYGKLGLGLVVAYLAGCCVNSWLFDFVPGYFFAFFAAVLFSGRALSERKRAIFSN